MIYDEHGIAIPARFYDYEDIIIERVNSNIKAFRQKKVCTQCGETVSDKSRTFEKSEKIIPQQREHRCIWSAPNCSIALRRNKEYWLDLYKRQEPLRWKAVWKCMLREERNEWVMLAGAAEWIERLHDRLELFQFEMYCKYDNGRSDVIIVKDDKIVLVTR